VSGGGTTLSSRRNGGARYEVDESDLFKLRRQLLAPGVPRLDEVLAGVRLQLSHHPDEDARDLGPGGPGRWVRRTAPGSGAPSLLVYYSIADTRVTLEYLVLPGAEPAAGVLDERVL
jgi:hypothetical protein